MIFTFYSYKGGVGRSMALANIAELFFQKGANVLMVDWDLEAPGLEKFFPDLSKAEFSEHEYQDFLKAYPYVEKVLEPIIDITDNFFSIKLARITYEQRIKLGDAVLELLDEKARKNFNKSGVIDLLSAYKRLLLSGKTMKEEDGCPFQRPVQSVYDVYPGSQNGKLWLLSAGRRTDKKFSEYANAVLRFDWVNFYENCYGEAYIEWLRREFEQMADIVLIDSRTGVTEMGGVCTYQLADVNVMFCAANDQNIEGTLRMLRSFSEPGLPDLRGGRELKTLVIPSRIDEQSADLTTLNRFRRMFKKNFTEYLPGDFQKEPEFFKQLEIPYVSSYAFGEMIAINYPTEENDYHSRGLIRAYNKLFQVLDSLTKFKKILYVEDELAKNIPRLFRLFGNYFSKEVQKRLKELEHDIDGYGADSEEIKQIFKHVPGVDLEYCFPDALAKILETPELYDLFIIDRNLANVDYTFEKVHQIDPQYSHELHDRFFEREGDYILLKLAMTQKINMHGKFYFLTAYPSQDSEIRLPQDNETELPQDIRDLIDFGVFQEKNFIDKSQPDQLKHLYDIIKKTLS